jgi:outer membrane protein
MKKTIQSLFALTAIALMPLSAHAQTSPKILVVDLAKLFDNHWKTQELQAKLNAEGVKAGEQASQLQKEGKALLEEFKDLDEQSKNPTATAEAKARAVADAQKKYEEVQEKHAELDSLAQTTQTTLHQRYDSFKTVMLADITKIAVGIAKAKGATFLLDKSGPTLVGVSNILYFDPSLDITDEVTAALSKDRPANLPTPTPVSSAAPAPSSGDVPQIAVPATAPGN